MKRTCCNALTILLAGLLLAGPALATDDASVSESKTPVDTSVSNAPMEPMNSRIGATSLDVDQVRELQRLLSQQGYSPGAADGIIGPRTTAAIRQFQTANELTANGTPDQATLRMLAPNAKEQEFFGLAPAYGEAEEGQWRSDPLQKMEPMKTEPAQKMGQPMKTDPAQKMEQPMKNESGERTEQPMKKGY